MNVIEERAKWKTIMTRPDTVIKQTGWWWWRWYDDDGDDDDDDDDDYWIEGVS